MCIWLVFAAQIINLAFVIKQIHNLHDTLWSLNINIINPGMFNAAKFPDRMNVIENLHKYSLYIGTIKLRRFKKMDRCSPLKASI